MRKNKFAFIFIFSISLTLLTLFAARSPSLEPQSSKNSPTVTIEVKKPPLENRSYQESIQTINSKDLKEIVYYLASDQFKGRRFGTPEADQVAEFIAKYMKTLGYTVGYQTFSTKLGTSKNVFAWREGTILPDEIIIVGAHYDHVGIGKEASRDGYGPHPGADDNASGVAAVLVLGQALAKTNFKRTTVFQFYTGEEQGMVGSRYYCQHPLFPRDHPDLKTTKTMVNFDMIGHYQEPVMFVSGRDYLMPFSDHEAFEKAGIPCVWFHHSAHNPEYHTRRDTADTLDYPGMEKITKKAFDVIWRRVQQ